LEGRFSSPIRIRPGGPRAGWKIKDGFTSGYVNIIRKINIGKEAMTFDKLNKDL